MNDYRIQIQRLGIEEKRKSRRCAQPILFHLMAPDPSYE
jgi:hypothetical protein